MGYDMYFRGKSWDDGDEVYFRLNIFHMGEIRDHMLRLGMVFDAGYPPDPDWSDEASVDAWRAWHGPEVRGIPEHKFCSNDGWLVLPAECQAAVKIGRESEPPAGDEDCWSRWLDYMDRASRVGGFEVH